MLLLSYNVKLINMKEVKSILYNWMQAGSVMGRAVGCNQFG